MVDWNKPIQFENGEPCTYGGTASNFEGSPHVVNRTGVEGMAGTWFYPEDGKSNWPGYNIINVTSDE